MAALWSPRLQSRALLSRVENRLLAQALAELEGPGARSFRSSKERTVEGESGVVSQLPKGGPDGILNSASMGDHHVFGIIEELRALAGASPYLEYSEVGAFQHGGQPYTLPRFAFRGPGCDEDSVRIGIFAAIHGDEVETAHASLVFLRRLLAEPERGRGYLLYIYPVCNPTGVEDGTRHSRNGLDLNREFWKGSKEPEVFHLERELGIQAFQGVISLHADDTTHGVYAYVRGATLTEALARPALASAEKFLPRALGDVIDSFPAKDALIHQHCFEGVLCNPRALRPAPFEIIFETPQAFPRDLQVEAAVAALDRILEEYRPFLAIQQNL